MKRLSLITMFLLLISFCSYSQNCKYQINEIDKFEKVEKVLTEKVKVMYPFSKFPVIWFSLGRINEDYIFKMEFSYTKNVCFNSKENELLIQTETDSIIRLQRKIDNVECTEYKNGIYYGTIIYKITEEKLIYLKNEVIIGIRFYNSEGYIESDFLKGNANKSKAQNYFKKYVDCILKE